LHILIAVEGHIPGLTETVVRIDDVEDNSILRRGIPVAHGIFGIPQTINSANYVYFMALQEVTKLNKPELLQVFTGMDSSKGFLEEEMHFQL
jgi:geranylgeranyl diphosphate synthase, type III